MTPDAAGTPRLCFIDNRRLDGPLFLHPLSVCTREGRRIGSFEGVLFDADAQRARYLVVDRSRLYPDRRIIPLPVRFDIVHQSLRVDVDNPETAEWEAFNPRQFRPFDFDDEATATVVRARK